MAGVPSDVILNDEYSRQAQQAALMMSANNALSHTPPSNWNCYSTEGATAASKSNLSLGHAGAEAVTGQMQDNGASNSIVGHRRWILYPQTQQMGAGSVTPIDGRSANALWVFDDNMWELRPAGRDQFVAWPPPGYVPYQVVYPRWSFSYPDADFSLASVEQLHNGTPINVSLASVQNGYGENTLVWIPSPYADGDNWAPPPADDVYAVTINNVRINGQSRSFNYSVTVFDPAVKGLDYEPQYITGADQLNRNESATYTFNELAIADGYEWRDSGVNSYTTVNDAENGLSNFIAEISSNYQAVDSTRPATGDAAYHLAHPTATNQFLTLDKTFLISANSQLQFNSYLGYASANQIAQVELSEDDGNSWIGIWQQAGQDRPATRYELQTVSLGEYANKTIQLRFSYLFDTGSYYPQTTGNVGWFFDDVELINVNQVTRGNPQPTTTQTSLVFNSSQAGQHLLQVRPRVFGEYSGEWSAAKLITVNENTTPDADDSFDRTTLEWQVTEIYIATLGYAPDNEGLQYWVNELRNGGWTTTTVAQAFFDNEIVQNLYPEDQGYAPLIEALYRNIFGREADTTGKEYWLGKLNSGAINRDQMIIALINGGWENAAATADMKRFGNRIQVGLAFANYQAQHRIVYTALSTAAQTLLRQRGAEVLTSVTDNNATRDAAIASIPSLFSAF
ncbi:DUF4214 domain-containing protein [Rhodoferax sp. 4810]|nr:DUF4214 domain-containing protein [Rhodoferax jenense]